MAQPIKNTQLPFDDAKLEAMNEPLTVRVEKLKNGARMPIPLPISENDPDKAPGTNFDKDGVRQLETWLVTHWAGGGLYEITVTDSTQPNPAVMRWRANYDIREYPEKVPPPLQSASSQPQLAPVVPLAPIVQQQAQGRMMTAFPNGLPTFPQMVQGYPQPQQYAYPPLPPAPVPGTPQWPHYQAEVERRETAAELRKLREDAAAREREATEARHKAELDRERQANEQRMAGVTAQFQQQMQQLQATVAQLTQQLQTAQTAPKTDPQVELMREQLRAAQAAAETERREREARERDAALREQMRMQQETLTRQIEAIQRASDERMRQFETLMQSQNNRGLDPMIHMFQELSRQQAEAVKEASRNAQMQMQSLQNYMMNPMQLMQLAKESSQGAEQASQRVAQLFSGVVDMQQKVMENALQMQPSGPGAIDLVKDGLDKVGTLVEKYVGGKQMAERMAQESQVAMAQAQAQAYAAAAQAQAAQQSQQTVYAPPPPKTEAQLAGPSEIPMTPVEVVAGIPAHSNIKRLGKTDHEWFGPLMSYIGELRLGAQHWLESLMKVPPRLDADGDPEGVSPEMAADHIESGIKQVIAHNIPVAALVDLFFQERFSDFVDVLLPDPFANGAYREEMTRQMINVYRKGKGLSPIDWEKQVDKTKMAPVVDDDGDDEDDDDDDDESESDEDGATPPPPAPAPKPNPKRR